MTVIEEVENILKEWNGGILRGAKTKFEKKIGSPSGKLSDYLQGRQNPSEITIKNMAKTLQKSEEEIRRLFCNKKEALPYTQNNIKSKGHFQQIINGYKEEVLAAQIRTLEAKLDLIIQLIKGGK